MSTEYLPESLNFLAPLAGQDLIRLGAARDGGYVVAKDSILKASALVSMGISTDWSFDEDFVKLNPKAIVHGYDHTVSERLFKRRLRKSIERFISLRSNFQTILDSFQLLNRYQDFFQGPCVHYQERVHNRLEQKYDATIQKIVERIGDKKVFLKIDIEGSEYRIIDDIVKYASNISGIAIEFHDTDHLRLVFLDAVHKLLKDFEIVHLHGNNVSSCAEDGLPDALELSFVHKALVTDASKRQASLPLVKLDIPNSPDLPDYPLRFRL